MGNGARLIQKKYGNDTLFTLDGDALKIPRVSSGSASLDEALGGGWPLYRIIEIYGPESSGKTTLALHAIASVQKEFGEDAKVAYVDVEHAIDPDYVRAIIPDVSTLYFVQPDSAEMTWDIVETLIDDGYFVVLDSIAALVPRAEIEGEMGDALVGVHARLNNQALRKLGPKLARSKGTLILINQIRYKIGGYGNPETTPGGNGILFYASVRARITRIGSEKSNGQEVANKTRVKIKKNKTAPPFREAEFPIVFGKGIDTVGELIEWAIENCKIVVKKGSYYRLIDPETGEVILNVQGKSKFIEEIRDTEHYEMLKTYVKDNR